MSEITYCDVMQLKATPEQIRSFIVNPQRIADYYPGLIEYGTFEPGKAIWCSAKTGVSLLELLEDECTDSRLTLRVVTSNSVNPPYSADQIRARPFISMVEDWETEAHEGGTRLTKTWRNVVKHKMKWLPMGFIIRRTAKAEHGKIVTAWNRAAAEQAKL